MEKQALFLLDNRGGFLKEVTSDSCVEEMKVGRYYQKVNITNKSPRRGGVRWQAHASPELPGCLLQREQGRRRWLARSLFVLLFSLGLLLYVYHKPGWPSIHNCCAIYFMPLAYASNYSKWVCVLTHLAENACQMNA